MINKSLTTLGNIKPTAVPMGLISKTADASFCVSSAYAYLCFATLNESKANVVVIFMLLFMIIFDLQVLR